MAQLVDLVSQYRKAAHYNVTHRRRQNFYALPTSQWQMLAQSPFNILSKFDRVDDAIDANANIASSILTTGLRLFGLDNEPKDVGMDWRNKATPPDMDKVRTTIRQLYRDWSAEGSSERRSSYEPVLRDLSQVFGDTSNLSAVKVLVPGAGLGRLVFEICKLGYDVEGNELSYHQLMVSNWILNDVGRDERFDLYPFAINFSNNLNFENQLKAVKVPDVHPGMELDKISVGSSVHAFERMNMTAGDFVQVYNRDEHKGAFDAVVTVFFTDTAPNVIRYIQVIYHCLKAGGVWINLGPLLWHFEERGISNHAATEKEGSTSHAGIEEPGSVELTNEELLLLVEKMGLDVEKHEVRTEDAGYIQDPQSMLYNVYRVIHWIARKSM